MQSPWYFCLYSCLGQWHVSVGLFFAGDQRSGECVGARRQHLWHLRSGSDDWVPAGALVATLTCRAEQDVAHIEEQNRPPVPRQDGRVLLSSKCGGVSAVYCECWLPGLVRAWIWRVSTKRTTVLSFRGLRGGGCSAYGGGFKTTSTGQ